MTGRPDAGPATRPGDDEVGVVGAARSGGGAGASDAAVVACLAGLERMTTNRLRALLGVGCPADGLAVVRGERPPPRGVLAALFERDRALVARWAGQVRTHPPERCAEELARTGTVVSRPGDAAFPPQLTVDPRCPPALFVRGDPGALDARRVGVVGTRNCTRRGWETAARFGHELALAGVVVVSGLALGIDGAAHLGALRAPGARPVAVVGCGPDVV
jgi:DNA processing protein